MSWLRERFTAGPRLHLRWMIRRDLPAAARIAANPGGAGWDEIAIRDAIRRPSVIGMVVERDDQVVGFMVYEMGPDRILLHVLGVAAEHRMIGVGRRMMERLTEKLSRQRRGLFVLVRETNLAAQFFFRACGLKAEHVAREWFRDTGEDAYSFAIHRDDRVVGWSDGGDKGGENPCLGN